jgi:integrase/recombinase XerC
MMNESVKKFLDYIKTERNFAENTIISYKNDLTQFFDFMNKKTDAKDILPVDIRGFVVKLSSEKYDRSSVERKIATLKSFFKFLKREGLIEQNPASLTAFPKKDKKLPRFLEEDEVRHLLDSVDTSEKYGLRDKAVLETLYSTGIRVS